MRLLLLSDRVLRKSQFLCDRLWRLEKGNGDWTDSHIVCCDDVMRNDGVWGWEVACKYAARASGGWHLQSILAYFLMFMQSGHRWLLTR